MLSIEDLTVTVTNSGEPIVSEVSAHLSAGRTMAIVGESGSGKSTILRALTRILPQELTASGRVTFHSFDLLNCSYNELRKIRRNEIRYIFQEPHLSLNPIWTIARQLSVSHRDGNATADAMRSILRETGLEDPDRVMGLYPHQMSIGMAQRVMIAMALLPSPSLIIADEPTSAVDVFLRMQLMEMVTSHLRKRGGALLFVTHDLQMARRFADNIAVLRAGRIVESADPASLFSSPRHPYTQELISSIPDISAVHV